MGFLLSISLQLLGNIYLHLRMTDSRLSALAIAAFMWEDQLSVLLMVTHR